MRTVLVTGSDTNVGKTHVVATLARMLTKATNGSGRAPRVQIVKVVETGRTGVADNHGDAATARRLSGAAVEAFTLASYPAPIAPASAAAAVGKTVSFPGLVSAVGALPECDWRILEGAGGVATPLDGDARDWADFANAVAADAVVVVVPDRLGAINQGRLAFTRAASAGRPAGVWLNATAVVDAEVALSTRAGLKAAGVPIWAEQGFRALEPLDADACLRTIGESASAATRPPEDQGAAKAKSIVDRCTAALRDRDRQNLRRTLRTATRDAGVLNLADNDYLELSHDPAVAAAVAEVARIDGTSASASPLITGWTDRHARLTARLAAWHGFAEGLLWSSGYAANSAVLGGLPERGDLVFADRLIHASMIAGLLRSGARLQRYEHLSLDRLEERLAENAGAERQIFVVTESVFSMDGDYPDLARMAELKRRYGFFWIVDEAHALGWYGPDGAGLVRAAGVAAEIDVLVGTFGKTLASGGAYTLFQNTAVRDYLVNTAGEFIYSTALAPTCVAAAAAALERVAQLAPQQAQWHDTSREFRRRLAADRWQVPAGDSPIVPVVLNHPGAALELADALRRAGIVVSAIRPPTVPAGTSRLRFSLKRSFGPAEAERVVTAMNAWRAAR